MAVLGHSQTAKRQKFSSVRKVLQQLLEKTLHEKTFNSIKQSSTSRKKDVCHQTLASPNMKEKLLLFLLLM